MATLPDNGPRASTPWERPGWLAAGEFFFGPPPSRMELVKGEVVSVLDLLRERRHEARDDESDLPLALGVAKLAVFLTVAIATTGLLVVGLGTFLVRAALGFIG